MAEPRWCSSVKPRRGNGGGGPAGLQRPRTGTSCRNDFASCGLHTLVFKNSHGQAWGEGGYFKVQARSAYGLAHRVEH